MHLELALITVGSILLKCEQLKTSEPISLPELVEQIDDREVIVVSNGTSMATVVEGEDHLQSLIKAHPSLYFFKADRQQLYSLCGGGNKARYVNDVLQYLLSNDKLTYSKIKPVI